MKRGKKTKPSKWSSAVKWVARWSLSFVPRRGRPPKNAHLIRAAAIAADRPVQFRCVAKLFDHSIHLSMHDERTSLYTLCREWLHNRPYSEGATPENGRNSGDHGADKPPVPLVPTDMTPFPVMKPFGDEVANDLTDSSCEFESASALLQHHKKRWVRVRLEWLGHRRTYLKISHSRLCRQLDDASTIAQNDAR